MRAVPLRKLVLPTGEGCTAMTSTPCGRASTASEVANREMKALVAEYIAVKGDGMYAAADEVKQMSPGRPEAYMRLRKWWVMRSAEMALQFTLARCFSVDAWWKKPVIMYPALLNRSDTCTSRVPDSIRRMYAPSAAARLTPMGRKRRSGKRADRSAVADTSSSSSSATRITLMPCRASATASSLPIPELAPVTHAHSAR
mmetsp:Transcript_31275/g.101005  ORF Transcript_31275/g.101005 Transcript_31275/m.101005 type:complete len:200 (+) Transcript_31275:624-1223(+)